MSAAKQSILVLGIRVGGAVLQMLLVATVALRFQLFGKDLSSGAALYAATANIAAPAA